MNKKLHNDFLILSGHSYQNGKFELPDNWEILDYYNEKDSGLNSILYKKDNVIVIAYRGTEKNSMNDLKNDFSLATTTIPLQYYVANNLYQNIKKKYPNFEITVTDHSLGGSLAQLVSATNGCPAVTFNAYGTGDIIRNMGISDLDIPNL